MLIFIHIPRTGGTSVEWILRNTYGIHHCDLLPFHEDITKLIDANDLKLINYIYPHLKSIASHNIRCYLNVYSEFQDLSFFIIIREPVNRIKKYYHFKTNQGVYVNDFERFVNRTSNEQSKIICGQASADKAIQVINEKNIFVGITEQFNTSMYLLKKIVCSELEVIRLKKNKSNENPHAKRILNDTDNIEFIKEKNSEDIKLYEYVIDNIYPSYFDRVNGNLKNQLDVNFLNKNHNIGNILSNRLYRNIVYKPFRYFVLKFMRV